MGNSTSGLKNQGQKERKGRKWLCMVKVKKVV
jgi:hypothetical protein